MNDEMKNIIQDSVIEMMNTGLNLMDYNWQVVRRGPRISYGEYITEMSNDCGEGSLYQAYVFPALENAGYKVDENTEDEIIEEADENLNVFCHNFWVEVKEGDTLVESLPLLDDASDFSHMAMAYEATADWQDWLGNLIYKPEADITIRIYNGFNKETSLEITVTREEFTEEFGG